MMVVWEEGAEGEGEGRMVKAKSSVKNFGRFLLTPCLGCKDGN